MKVGIVTTQYASNYGALLQAYALQSFINTFDKIQAEVINYYPEHYKDYWIIFPKCNSVKATVLNILLHFHPNWVKSKRKRFENFKTFRKNYIKCGKEFYSANDFTIENCPYDVLICGSDQIWNVSRHKCIDPIWFLDIPYMTGNPRKISYAPSVADEIPSLKKEEIQRLLNGYNAISVREDVDVDKIQELTSLKVKHVCDPVFLLNETQWRDIAVCPQINHKYILCYFLNPSDVAIEVVKQIKIQTGLPIIHLNVNDLDKFSSDADIRDASPLEFLGYIQNAEYVLTNSFHCTAFSILFKKNFWVIPKRTANSRMESLLRKSNLKDRILNQSINFTSENILKDIDYTAINEHMQTFIQESKEYLEKEMSV